MKPCPRCRSMPAWILGDGRFKCQVCGNRYSWRSVWDSVRLPDRVKRDLLDAFVHGVSVYRQRFDEGACVDSRERFYRLIRACCAASEPGAATSTYVASCRTDAYGAARARMRGWSSASHVMIIGIAAADGLVRMDLPRDAISPGILALLRQRTAVGGLYFTGADRALASLQVHGDCVVVDGGNRVSLSMSPIELFWDDARQRLHTLRNLPCRFFHLYLGEMCFRFNHRERDLTALLAEHMQSLSIGEIRRVISSRTALRPDLPAQGSHALPGSSFVARKQLDA